MNEDEDAQVENIPPSTVVIEYMKHRGLRALWTNGAFLDTSLLLYN